MDNSSSLRPYSKLLLTRHTQMFPRHIQFQYGQSLRLRNLEQLDIFFIPQQPHMTQITRSHP